MNENHPFAECRRSEVWWKELNAPGISLAEARAFEIPHGPLRQVKYKWSRRGMAVDDLEIHEYILTWTDGGASFRYRNSQ
ncbi:MAG: hypothetical protein K6A33_07510, partial [Clostridiales bacterium]|nr:hypothetical protein [Clostridiales bacterium]